MNKERNNRFKIRTINSKYLLICFAVSVLISVTACRHKGNTLTPTPAASSDDSTPSVTPSQQVVFDVDVATKTLKGYKGDAPKGKLVIPSNIYGTDIEHIGENAFKGCTDLTEVVIGDGIKTVGKNAFSGCKKLAKIELPKVMEIGDYTFANTEIESITIPEVTKIGSSAFAGCKKLKTVDMPKVTELGTGVFKSSGLETVTIPNGITKITDSLFEKCENLTTVTMHNNITEIGISGFEGCKNLVSLTLSTGLLKTGSKSFKSSGIERMDFPQGFTNLGDSSFEECAGLKVVYLPSSVTYVGNDAFKKCNQSATVYAKTTEVQTKAKGKGLPDGNIKLGDPPNTP